MSFGNILTILNRPRRNRTRARRVDHALRYGFHQFDRLEERALLSTLSQTQIFGPEFTPITDQPLTPTITKFDTQGGIRTLDSVEIIESSKVETSLSGSISNPTGSNQTFTYTASVTGASTSASGPAVNESAGPSDLLNFNSGSVTLAPGGTFTITPQTNFLPTSADIKLTNGVDDLSPFMTTGTETLGPYTTSADATANAVLSGSANLQNNVLFTTKGEASVTVIYTFHNNPTITTTTETNTTPSTVVAIGSGDKMNDSAVLENGDNPTGTLTFELFNSSNTSVYIDHVTVNGNGVYDTATMGDQSGGFLPNVADTYHWVVSFNSDNPANNSNVDQQSNDETVNAVDALIAISPLTAPDNPVNTDHTLTITVTAFPAGTTATGDPIFATPTVTFVQPPDADGDPSSPGTVTQVGTPVNNGDGTWTATYETTISSNVAGHFIINASDTVTMGGVDVTRTTGDGFTSGDGSDSDSAVKNYFVPELTPGQIAPTNTTAAEFANGTAATLDAVNYTIKNGKITQNVNPGVFFYFSFATATTDGANTITVTETPPSGFPPFKIAGTAVGNVALYNANGTQVVAKANLPLPQDGSVTFTTPNSTKVGDTFVVLVKYDTKSIAGKTVPGGTVHYTWVTSVDSTQQATAGVDLVQTS